MNLRTLLLLGSVLVIAHTNLFAEAKYSKYTADYYKGAYDLYEGQEITLKVAFVKPYSYKSDIPDVRFFHAITRDDQKNMEGGEIPVAVPLASGDELIRRYGTAGSEEEKTHLLKGVLRADGHGLWFVDVNGALTKLIDARRQTEMKAPVAAASPTAATTSAAPAAEATPADEKPESKNGAEHVKPWWKVW